MCISHRCCNTDIDLFFHSITFSSNNEITTSPGTGSYAETKHGAEEAEHLGAWISLDSYGKANAISNSLITRNEIYKPSPNGRFILEFPTLCYIAPYLSHQCCSSRKRKIIASTQKTGVSLDINHCLLKAIGRWAKNCMLGVFLKEQYLFSQTVCMGISSQKKIL